MKATLIVAFALFAPVAAVTVTAPGLMRREPEVTDGAMIQKPKDGDKKEGEKPEDGDGEDGDEDEVKKMEADADKEDADKVKKMEKNADKEADKKDGEKLKDGDKKEEGDKKEVKKPEDAVKKGGSCSAKSDSNCCFTKAAIDDIKKSNPNVKVVQGQCAAGTKDIAGEDRYATLWKKLKTCKTDACQATNVPAGTDGTCKSYVCPKGYSTRQGVAKAPCNSATSCNFNCCDVEINADPVRKMGVLTYAALWAVANVTKFSNEIGFPFAHEAINYKDDVKALNDAVLGLTTVMNDIGNTKSCPPQKAADDFSHLNHIKACVDAALCEMAANEKTKEEVKTITMLREYYGKFETITWDYLWENLAGVAEDSKVNKKAQSAFANTKVDFVEAAELECIGIAGFMKNMGSAALLDMDKEAAYATSKALYEAARVTHAVVNAHTDNSSLDATIAALHRAWEPACKLLHCDHTNYWDMLGASHLHSIALIEAGASSHHMQVHVRTRARLDFQMQQFLGAQVQTVANKFYRVAGTSTEARTTKYAHFLMDGLQHQMTNHPKTYGIDALTGLYDKDEMKKSFKTPVQAALLAGYWDNRLFIVDDEQDLAEVAEIQALVREQDLDEDDDEKLDLLIHRTMFWKAIGNFFQDAGNFVKNVAQSTVNGIVHAANIVGAAAVAIGKGLAKVAVIVGKGFLEMGKYIGKGIVKGLTALGEAIITVATVIGRAIEAFIDFIVSLFNCIGFGTCCTVGYGKKWYIKPPLGVAISLAATAGNQLKLLLYGIPVSGIGISMGFVAGIVKGGGDKPTGGLRIGVGIAMGVYCDFQKGCLIEISVGVVCSAIVPMAAGSKRCVLGPFLKIGPLKMGCFQSFGIVLKLICCFVDLTTGCQSCKKGGCDSAGGKSASSSGVSKAKVDHSVKSTTERVGCDEYFSGSGWDYRGCQTKTRSGRDCQKWTSQYPHKWNPQKGWAENLQNGLGDHNMCRNPNSGGWIWCHTSDPNTRWEWCDVLDVFTFANHASIVALHSRVWNRFVKMNGWDMVVSPWRNYDQFPNSWGAEKFRVIMADGNKVAFHHTYYNRFIRMNGWDMDCSGHHGGYDLPSGWTWERFGVTSGGRGELGFQNGAHRRFMRMNGNRMDGSGHRNLVDRLPKGWTWERFKLLIVSEAARIEPGMEVGLHNRAWNRFVRMSSWDMDTSPWRNWDQFPGGWTWERFKVVSANSGIMGFHSKSHNRFVSMCGGDMYRSPGHNLGKVPGGWTWQKWRVVHGGGSELAFHNPAWNRFARMNGNRMDSSGGCAVNGLPGGWTWERFKVIDTSGIEPETNIERLQGIGDHVALRGGHSNRWCSDYHNRIVCAANGQWQWEKFLIGKASGGQIGLRGGRDKRWCTDVHNNVQCGQNGIWQWEKFHPVKAAGDRAALKGGKDNRYCADEYNQWRCNRNAIGQWEKFLVHRTVTVDKFNTWWLNLRGRYAAQSHWGWNAPASRAIDGNSASNFPSGSCTHTHYIWTAWWYVHLGSDPQAISKLKVTNRGDCCGWRLNGFKVVVTTPIGTTCASNVQIHQGQTKELTCTAYGRDVKIQLAKTDYLTLCEVQIATTR